MISLDWKERIIKDTTDFFERKLPRGDFDIDIVYNAYPQRIYNKVPQAVITLVGKTLAATAARFTKRLRSTSWRKKASFSTMPTRHATSARRAAQVSSRGNIRHARI